MTEVVDEIAGDLEVPAMVIPGWAERYGVIAGITTRGEPNEPFDLGIGGSAPIGAVLDRYKQLAATTKSTGIAIARQVHRTAVHWHQSVAGLVILPDTDGHATSAAGTLLGVSSADCVPIYLVDPVRRAVALLHAGWRGTAAGVLSAGLEVLKAQAGTAPSDIAMHCGVGVCGACYQVGPEVAAACGQPRQQVGPLFLDLRQVLAEQARRAGIGQVSVSSLCSAHMTDRFMSHRGSRGTDGRMLAFLGLRPDPGGMAQ